MSAGNERAAEAAVKDSTNRPESIFCRCASCGRPLPPVWCASCLDHLPVIPRRLPVRLRIARWIVNWLGDVFWWAQQRLSRAETRHANEEASR